MLSRAHGLIGNKEWIGGITRTTDGTQIEFRIPPSNKECEDTLFIVGGR